MGYAGYDDYGYGGGGYYALPLPGGDLDARTYLDGPGTHAYLQQGRYSSYAYEGQNGSIFEQNTTTSSGGYEQSTYYLYTSESYRYSHSADFSYSNPPLYLTTGGFGYTTQQPTGYYGPYGSPYGPGRISTYNVIDIEIHTNGAYSTSGFQDASEINFEGGYYRNGYSAHSGTYLNGHLVPGTATSYSGSSYGYFTSYSS